MISEIPKNEETKPKKITFNLEENIKPPSHLKRKSRMSKFLSSILSIHIIFHYLCIKKPPISAKLNYMKRKGTQFFLKPLRRKSINPLKKRFLNTPIQNPLKYRTL